MKKRPHSLDDIVGKITPEAVIRYLRHLGFTESERSEKMAAFVAKDGNSDLVVPLKRSLRDYVTVIKALFESLTTATKHFEDILVEVSVGPCDILRHGVHDFDTAWGSASFPFAEDAIPGFLSLVKFSAAGVHSQQRSYTDIPNIAKELYRSCRLGQTEIGSFVIKAYCPINVMGTIGEYGETGFGRLVAMACAENIAFFAREDAAEPDVSIPATVNAQVANAVHQMAPLTDFVSGSFELEFSDAVDAGERIQTDCVALDRQLFQRAGLVLTRLNDVTAIEEEKLFGKITELHKPSMGKFRVNYEVVMDCQWGGSKRKLRVPLLKRQHDRAVRWYEKDLEVFVYAAIDKRTRPWSVAALKKFEPATTDTKTLFA